MNDPPLTLPHYIMDTKLLLASRLGNMKSVKFLLKKGADIECKDVRGCTPLYKAISEGTHPEVVDFLLVNGANIEVKFNGRTLLHMACERGNLKIVKSLLKKGADIESKNCGGCTPLHWACNFFNFHLRYVQVVKFLLGKGANIDSKDARGCTPLHMAILAKNLELVDLLLEQGADTELKSNYGLTPLHLAIHSRLKIIELLLEQGSNTECKDDYGRTPLYWANSIGYSEVVRFLEDYIFSKKIQYFFRVITAKSISNRLRMEPRNLFDPEFSGRRKFLLKIDDSRFN